MNEIAEALMQLAKELERGEKTAAARPWSPRVMGEWIKTVKAPTNALGHEWKKVSTSLKKAERNLGNRQELYAELLDARDALDAIADYHRMANNKVLGALQYVDMAEE